MTDDRQSVIVPSPSSAARPWRLPRSTDATLKWRHDVQFARFTARSMAIDISCVAIDNLSSRYVIGPNINGTVQRDSTTRLFINPNIAAETPEVVVDAVFLAARVGALLAAL